MGSRPEPFVVSYPLFPDNHNPVDNGTDLWRRAAAGEFDSYHQGAAAGLATISQRLIMRIGWEWNNSAFKWRCHDQALAGYYKT